MPSWNWAPLVSSQEMLEFTEDADLIWTDRGGEFDQVRCKKQNKNKSKGTTQPSWYTSRKLTNENHLVTTSAHPPLLSLVIWSLRGRMAPNRRREEDSGGRASGGALRFRLRICCVTTECEQGWCDFIQLSTHDTICVMNWIVINWTTFGAYVWDNTKMNEVDRNKQNIFWSAHCPPFSLSSYMPDFTNTLLIVMWH